jgi:threonine synthase
MSGVPWTLRCAECGATYPGLEERHRCACGAPLDVRHAGGPGLTLAQADARLVSRRPEDRSGVWRFREWVLPLAPGELVTRQEGHTNLYDAPAVAAWAGVGRLRLKHEGENPTASFKDRGMTVAVSMAKKLGKRSVACASTGNTSASMASYAATAGMKAYVFIPEGKVAFGKLSQAMAYGATTLQIAGDFDRAMTLVEQLAAEEGVYLVNSVNPFRVEGQKAIAFELLQDLEWRPPDWIVLPGGNLGNNWAIAKGLAELYDGGLIPKLPRLAVIQAAGANPLYTAFTQGRPLVPMAAETLATAIRIGNPVSWQRSLRGLARLRGVVEEVSDQELMTAKAEVDAAGIGAEPASCATVAGLKKLVAAGAIDPDADICGILTGHVLKDPGTVVDYHLGKLAGIQSTRAHAPIPVEGTLEAVRRALSAGA